MTNAEQWKKAEDKREEHNKLLNKNPLSWIRKLTKKTVAILNKKNKSCKNFTLPLNFRSVEHRVSFSHAKELSHWACARGHKRATILLASSTKLWHTREFIGFVFTEAWMRQRSGFTVSLHPCGPAPLPAALKAFWSNFLSVRCMNAKCLHDQIKVTGLKNK